MNTALHNNLSRYVSFTDDELKVLDALIKPQFIPKRTTMLRSGEKCNFEAYVVKGCVRKYYIDADGNELILQFGVEDHWVGDISFNAYDDQPSRVFIETMEDSEFLMFDPESKEELFARVPKFERAFRILVQRHLASTQNRLFDSVSKNATDKYLEFLRLYPTIPQRVAQHYIASYLGISPEFLSKVRARLAKH
ncbi:Crp/Fnr family transcriptional regulator [Flavobacterium sp. MAH-1]|uniref:Crp/Fnr family transcriptional regulator n=1 Tax=Flavobacterium agri TaxID=2743471 RepID=A0A7Y8Y3A3_9FLAO|nr:Crp/Fnr family transcriptional regulator [Flavobacterium agri]NUY81790.1 Crp/Fnr family transcriptional regulator [Flavobacterium agri]NYA71814.1 Crp/Fnr family transcriptional regulator [Flavobacterium agri]